MPESAPFFQRPSGDAARFAPVSSLGTSLALDMSRLVNIALCAAPAIGEADEIPFHSRCRIALHICCASGRLPNDGTCGSIHDGSRCRNRPSEERRAALHRR
jgi:hypothetical protein